MRGLSKKNHDEVRVETNLNENPVSRILLKEKLK